MPKENDGVTEVVGFAFVIIILIFGIIMWLLVAMPIYGTNDELQHNTAVEFEMTELKDDIETMCLSNALGIKRQKVINLAPTSDKSRITAMPDIKTLQSYGSITLKCGDPAISGYCNLVIDFKTSNTYADDITVTYDGGSLYVDGQKWLIAPTNSYFVVKSGFEKQTIGSNEAVVVEYSVIDMIISGGKKYYVLSIGLK